MENPDNFRSRLIADYISRAVRIADRIQKKINILEFDRLFKVNGEYITISPKDKAYAEIRKMPLSPEAKKWLNEEKDIVNWQTGAYTMKRINELFDLNLRMFEDWDLAQMRDNELFYKNVMLAVDRDDENYNALDEDTRREVRIIFDAVDNSKYFIYGIKGYFSKDGIEFVDEEYMNHLKARL